MSSTLRPRQLNDLLPSSPLNHQREPKRLHLSYNCFYTCTCTYVSPVPSSQYFRRVFLRCSSFRIRIRKKTSTSMAFFLFFFFFEKSISNLAHFFRKINNAVSEELSNYVDFSDPDSGTFARGNEILETIVKNVLKKSVRKRTMHPNEIFLTMYIWFDLDQRSTEERFFTGVKCGLLFDGNSSFVWTLSEN